MSVLFRRMPPLAWSMMMALCGALLFLPLRVKSDPLDGGVGIDPEIGHSMPLPASVETSAPPGLVPGMTGDITGDSLQLALVAVKVLGDRTTAWTVKAGILLMLAVIFFRHYATKKRKVDAVTERYYLGKAGAFFNTSDGGVLLLLLLSFTGVVAGVMIKTPPPIHWGSVFWSAFTLAILAAGGWHVVVKPAGKYLSRFGMWLLEKFHGMKKVQPSGRVELRTIGGMALVLAGGILLLMLVKNPVASAQVSSLPFGRAGRMTLAAATATKVPTTGLSQRNAVAIKNRDAADVCVGFETSVTCTTGWPLAPGESVSLPMSWRTDGQKDVYLYSVGGTAANAIAWLETR